jgi:hypothetical protein
MYLANQLSSRESFAEKLVDIFLEIFEGILLTDLQETIDPLGRNDPGHLVHVAFRDRTLFCRADSVMWKFMIVLNI